MSAHPLLLKLLRDAAAGSAQYADWLADAIPDDIADQLEAALGACAWNGCGRSLDDDWHGDPEGHDHAPRWTCHRFVPLVPLP